MTKIEGKEKNKKEWKFVDATPDGNYALRILQAYRGDCNIRWSDTSLGLKTTDPLCVELNKLQDERAKELDEAIDKLLK